MLEALSLGSVVRFRVVLGDRLPVSCGLGFRMLLLRFKVPKPV